MARLLCKFFLSIFVYLKVTAPKQPKLSESLVSGRLSDKAKFEKGIAGPQLSSLPSAHDWKRTEFVQVAPQGSTQDEVCPTYGLTLEELDTACALKRALQMIHGKVLKLLEVETSHDKDFYMWVSKVTASGYVYYSPTLDINTGKVNRGHGEATKIEGVDLFKGYKVTKEEDQDGDEYEHYEMWYLSNSELKEQKKAVRQLIVEANDVFLELGRFYEKTLDRRRSEGATESDLISFADWFRLFKSSAEWAAHLSDKKSGLRLAQRTELAVKRLMRDLRECERNPLPCISAAPLSMDDLFEWHCNIETPPDHPNPGLIFHVTMSFPQTYPVQPPTVKMRTPICHPNVFGNRICLDMLSLDNDLYESDSKEKYWGWSSAYSVQSILMQLQAFLFEPTFVARKLPTQDQWVALNGASVGYPRYNAKGKKMSAEEVQAAKASAMVEAYRGFLQNTRFDRHGTTWSDKQMKDVRQFKCLACTHTFHRPNPPLPQVKRCPVAPDLELTESKNNQVPAVRRLPPPVEAQARETVTEISQKLFDSILVPPTAAHSIPSLPPAPTPANPNASAPELLPAVAMATSPVEVKEGDVLGGRVVRLLDFGALVDVKWLNNPNYP